MRSNAAFAVLVALHAAAAVVGFGAVALSGLYGATARRLDLPASAEEARRWFGTPNRAAWAVLAVPALGAAALAAGGRDGDFGQVWVGAALGVWAAAAAVAVLVVRPAEAALGAALAEAAGAPPPGASPGAGDERGPGPGPRADRPAADPAVSEAASAGRRLQWGAGVCDVAFAVAVGLMVWQPR